jgi:hypothetical protein
MRFGENEFHIVHGDGMGGTLRELFDIPPSRILCNRDSLSCGPLAPLGDPSQWDRLRLSYWETVVGAAPQGLTFWQQLLAARDRLADADCINLWLGPALDESLLTGFLLEAISLLELKPSRLRLVDLEPVFEALGERLRMGSFHNEFLQLAGPWRSMDRPAQSSYRQLWRAATAPTPELMIDYCRSDTPWPAPLKEALRAWIAWYPAVKSGLGFWDEMLLYHSSSSPVTVAHTIGGCLRHASGLVDPGDAWLFHRLRRLADPESPWPLLEMTGDGQSCRHTLTRLTDAGIDVVNGDENAIVLNGIEDRIGGVRLSLDEDRMWFYDGDLLIPRDRIA